jgi:hypothetical protein
MEHQKETRMMPVRNKRFVSKALLLAMLACICSALSAQKIWEERTGCVIGQGDLAPGYLFAQKAVTAYVDGDIAIFFENHFAAEGAIWVSFATAAQGAAAVKVNDALFWGAEYHFIKPNRWDPFVSLTPGVGLVRVSYNGDAGDIQRTPFTAVPLGSMSLGCNYYVGSIFHFFLKVQGVVGQVSSKLPTTQRLDELKFTGGLAFNLRLWKPKNYKPKV